MYNDKKENTVHGLAYINPYKLIKKVNDPIKPTI